ncbi:MAG: isopenicillin N synthase family oxygenase [Burkholderiales bacterium]|nr:isopenicillin N synthase family oxygenase [Burkholderiales bacterium]
MIPYVPARAAEAVPVIDLAGASSAELANRLAVAGEVHRACRDIGFFYVANHGVDRALVAAQFDWARRFFALPQADKDAIALSRSPCNRGYEPMGGQTLDADTPPDLKEGFYMGWHLEPDHPLVRAGLPNHGPNAWPAGLPGFREQMQAYYAALFDLGRRIARLVALSLELPEDHFDGDFETPMTILRLLHYPPHPANARPNQLGAGAHTDWGLITILAQDDCGGLEVRNADGVWLQAPPIPDTFVVNLGDMLERWTNGLYRSNLHRVRNAAAGRDRYSVPFFLEPSYHVRLECLPTCTGPGNPPRYPPCSAGEHIAEMYRRTYAKAA